MRDFAELSGHYTKIPNELLNDPTLSFKAKGLYCHMASKPDTYNFTARSLATQFSDGVRSILNALKELKNRGWLSYIKNGNGTGKYSLNTSLKPALTPDTANVIQAEPETGNGVKGAEPKADNGVKGAEPKGHNPNMGFSIMPKSVRINKKDFNNKKDLYKRESRMGGDVILEPQDGDQFGSSTRYTQNEILMMLSKGVIDVT